jgi:nucleoside-diphosphate-sugar epimerase
METVCLAAEKLAALVGREPSLSRRSLKFFSDSAAFDIGKARRLLDFDPQVDTRQGLRRTIEYYRQQGVL